MYIKGPANASYSFTIWIRVCSLVANKLRPEGIRLLKSVGNCTGSLGKSLICHLLQRSCIRSDRLRFLSSVIEFIVDNEILEEVSKKFPLVVPNFFWGCRIRRLTTAKKVVRYCRISKRLQNTLVRPGRRHGGKKTHPGLPQILTVCRRKDIRQLHLTGIHFHYEKQHFPKTGRDGNLIHFPFRHWAQDYSQNLYLELGVELNCANSLNANTNYVN